MYKTFYILLILLFISCKNDTELAIERGIQFYDWAKYNDAVLEFNKAKYFQITKSKQSYSDLKLLAQTYYNLAITYAKLNMYDAAYNEAQHAVSLIPNKEYREVLELIKKELVFLQNQQQLK